MDSPVNSAASPWKYTGEPVVPAVRELLMAPSSVFKSHKVSRWSMTVAAAALVFTLGLALPAGPAAGQSGGIDRSVIPIAPDAPERYVVVKGDTLWDISAKFLRDPWFWPEIWYVNPQVENPHLIYPGDVLVLTWVDGRPRLSLETGGATRLSPRVREQPLSEAIRAIPWEVVEAFMSKPTVLAQEQIESAPYVVTARDDRLITGPGDQVYVRRLGSAVTDQSWLLYHVGEKLRDPETGDTLGFQGIYTATGKVTRTGDPATLLLTDSARETKHGDVALPDPIEVGMDFIPHPPSGSVDGVIMSVVDKHLAIGQYHVVVINRGSRDGLEAGNVLSIWKPGKTVKDETKYRESSKVDLPENRIGRFMVFKCWDRLSYGLVLNADREISIGDVVRNP